ncbi:hypothetical protein BWD42_08610 [Sphingobacterium sp. CZ-UAM]|uniref:hypothetical protein n=1 Tax=unclassified Sphingobacterium TaxID=2609468 RepID=UPI000984643A|nr:hypothetical protein [Sphingobacterium sp. CZ-UAM]OOG19932.1 hypothetical protein BWD42_08610 [Sphingobacterium sp. CZ-UAM]
MNSIHLTEVQLQALADSTDATTRLEMDHISTCMACRIKFENYQLINSTIHELPIASFDPDLTDYIVDMLMPKKAPIHWAALLSASLGGLLVVVAAVIFGKQFIALFIQLPDILRYFFALLPLSLISIQTILSLIRYRQKMNTIIKKTDSLQPKLDW